MRLGSRISVVIILLALGLGAASPSHAEEPEINALSAVLMDARTGEVLYAKNPNLRRPPASTTKIVAGIIALESGDPQRIVTVSRRAAKEEGSSVWLQPGEKQRLLDLIYGLMLGSGNDAAVAIAEDLAGSEEAFAERMTEKAHQLGALNTQFKNASGLPAEGHYTTAYDLALLTCYALKNPEFSRIVQTKEYTLPGNDLQKERLICNHNQLLWQYAYADGVKTGYTRQAGKCLAASATKDGRRLVAVVFHSETMYEDSRKLLDYGFSHFRLVSLNDRRFLETVPVKVGTAPEVEAIPGKDIQTVVPAQDLGKVRVETVLKDYVEAPVVRLQRLGEVQLYVGEKLIDKAPLLAAKDVPRDTFVYKVINWLKRLLGLA